VGAAGLAVATVMSAVAAVAATMIAVNASDSMI
ncbi:hypothetical protein Tco_1296054, partial [Tanacetum coccineum]